MAQNMNVSVTLRFVDQFTSGIRQLQQQLQQFANAAQNINRQLGGSGSNSPLAKMQATVKQLSADVRQLTNGFQAFNRAAGASPNGGFVQSQTQSWRQLLQLQQQAIANNRAMAGGPGGPGGRGPGPGGARGGGWWNHYNAHGLGPAGMFAPTRGQLHWRAHQAAHSAFQEGLSLDVQYSMLDRLGFTQPEAMEAIEAARNVSRLVPSSNEQMNLHRIYELRYAFGDLHHALDALADLSRAQTVINSMDPHGMRGGEHLADQVMEMVKAGEMRGVVNNPDQFREFIDWTVRIAQSSGGLVDPRTMFGAYKYARTSLFGFSADFLYLVFPEIMQEIKTGRSGGASSAGVIADAFRRVVVNGRMSNTARGAWEKYGLIDPKTGAPVDPHLGGQNPFLWTERYVLGPRGVFARHGIDPNDKSRENIARMTKIVGDLFETRTAQQFVDLFVVQHDQMLKRMELTRRAAGLEDAYRLSTDQLNTAVSEVNSKAKELGATLLNMVKPGLQRSSNLLSGGLGWTNQTMKDNPLALLQYGMMGVGGLAMAWRSLLRPVLGGALRALGPQGGALLGGGLGFLGTMDFTGLMAGAMIGERLSSAAGAAGGAAGAVAARGFSARFLGLLTGLLRGGLRLAMNPVVMFAGFEIYQHWTEISAHLKAIWADLWQALPTFLGGQGRGPTALTQGQGLTGANEALRGYMSPIGDWFLNTPWGQAMHARGLITTMDEYVRADWLRRNFDMNALAEDARLQAQVPGAGATGTGNSVTVTGTTINVSISTQPGADANVIGAAAGNAVGSALRGVLGDVPAMP